jgi:hypoxanthine phosphoribosyltransferase
MEKKLFYNWQDFEDDIEFLAKQIKKDNIPYKRIVAITRGGLFVAGLLSQYLDSVPIDTISIHSYYGSERKRMIILKENMSKELTLICDDVIDTGKTMEEAKKMYPNSKIIVLHFKSKNKPSIKPDYFMEDTNSWVVYPWEVNEK